MIGQLFSCEMENCSMCRCGKETVRVSSTLLFTLSYPDSTGNSRAQPLSWVGFGIQDFFPAGTHPQPGAASAPEVGFPTCQAFGFKKTLLGLDLLVGGYEENPRGLAELSWPRFVCWRR